MILHQPVVTLIAAGLLGLLFIALSARVVMGRTTGKIMLGTGQDEAGPFYMAMRAHANFAEYVPFCLVLVGLLELRSGATVLVKVLAAVLVLARVAHPVGMAMKAPNPFRAGGFIGTILVLAAGSIAALFAALG